MVVHISIHLRVRLTLLFFYLFLLLNIWFLLKDGGGGKGTWGKLLDTDGESHIDRNDPNYDSGEVFATSE